MELTDFAKGSVWGIRPEVLTEIMVKIPDIDKKTVEKQDNMAWADELVEIEFVEKPEKRNQLKLIDGVAVIPVLGPLTKRSSFFSFLFGGSGYNQLAERFMAAMEESQVQAVLLDIDSPGGCLDGLEAFSDLIFEARKEKPVVAFANGNMCSAAYWIGSGAKKIVTERSAWVGSIGVMTTHYDWSKNDEMYGLKRTILFAGKYKALGNDTEPLSDLATKEIKGRLEYSYDMFIETVAANRGVAVDYVREYMAEGKIFIGQQAVDVGLADKTGSFETAVETARSFIKNNPAFTLSLPKATNLKEDKTMKIETLEQLKSAFPNLAKQLEDASRKEGVESVDLSAAEEEARAAERDRILGLVEVQFGKEAFEAFKSVVATGVTVDQFKAIKDATPEAQSANSEAENVEKNKQAMLEAIQNNGQENPGANNPNLEGKKDYLAMVNDYQAAQNCGRGTAMMAIAKSHPEAHQEYLKSVNTMGNA